MNKTLETLIKYIPKEHLTEEFLSDLNIDLSGRGDWYIRRCFIDDNTGRLEKSLSDTFLKEYNRGDLLDEVLIPCQENHETLKACATLYQWLGTNVGRGNLEEAYRKAGWTLTWKAGE